MNKPESIDWSNPKSKISEFFTVGEATYLPSWKTYHIPSEEEKANICLQASKMDLIRRFLGKPIKIHVWMRPEKANCPGSEHNGEDYNKLIGGAKLSAHRIGAAADWDANENCDDTRNKLESKLEEYQVRMEKKPNSSWVHIDFLAPKPNRYFIP